MQSLPNSVTRKYIHIPVLAGPPKSSVAGIRFYLSSRKMHIFFIVMTRHSPRSPPFYALFRRSSRDVRPDLFITIARHRRPSLSDAYKIARNPYWDPQRFHRNTLRGKTFRASKWEARDAARWKSQKSSHRKWIWQRDALDSEATMNHRHSGKSRFWTSSQRAQHFTDRKFRSSVTGSKFAYRYCFDVLPRLNFIDSPLLLWTSQ